MSWKYTTGKIVFALLCILTFKFKNRRRENKYYGLTDGMDSLSWIYALISSWMRFWLLVSFSKSLIFLPHIRSIYVLSTFHDFVPHSAREISTYRSNIGRLICIWYQSNTTIFVMYKICTNYMFRPFLVRPSSGWIHLLEELNYNTNTIQYNERCRVSGGDEISFTKVRGVCGTCIGQWYIALRVVILWLWVLAPGVSRYVYQSTYVLTYTTGMTFLKI